MYTHNELLSSFKKSFRNGNWKKLSSIEKGLYRASLAYARFKGKIVNSDLRAQLSIIIDKILSSPGMKILERGYERASILMQRYEEEGVFNWAPQLRKWLKNPDYIGWLGTLP